MTYITESAIRELLNAHEINNKAWDTGRIAQVEIAHNMLNALLKK